jgi:hypothetical protein
MTYNDNLPFMANNETINAGPGLTDEAIYYKDDFCRLTDHYFCDAWMDYIELAPGIAAFLKKHFDKSPAEGFKWLTIYERL